MNSSKISTGNKYLKDNDIRQKLVTVSNYNELWDDTKAIEDAVNAIDITGINDDIADLDDRITQAEQDILAIQYVVEPFIVDRGLGDTSLVCYCKDSYIRMVNDPLFPQPIARLFFLDSCYKMHYTGNEVVTYHMDAPNAQGIVPVSNTNASQCYIDFNCAHVGQYDITIWATTPSLQTVITTICRVMIIDNAAYCGM